jgi:signal transduction histidine kinase
LESISVSSILESLSPTAEFLAKAKRNTFIVQVTENYTFLADRTRFFQVLLNLISNACKFTEDGTVTLKIYSKLAGDKAWVCWSVTDTGIGIAKENYDKLFKSFSQVDSSATRRHDGTGLGLAISKNFCEKMGGTIEFSSEPGKGSQFIVHIPMAIETAAAKLGKVAINVGDRTV